MARQLLTTALLLLACVAGASAKKVTTQIKDLGVRNSDPGSETIMAGDNIIVSGRLAYGGQGGPSVSRLVVCQDTQDSSIFGTGMTKGSGAGKNRFAVTIDNVVEGFRTFRCNVQAVQNGGNRYTAASNSITIPVDMGGTAPPTPTTSPPPPPPPKKTRPPPPPKSPPPPPKTPSPTCARPKRCNTVTDYRATCECKSCLTRNSGFYRVRKRGNSCAPPYTMKGTSSTCSPAPLVALVQSKGDPKVTVSCITTEDRQVNLLLSTSHKGYLSFFNQNSIRDNSLFLDNVLPLHGSTSLVNINGNVYKKYSFIDHKSILKKLSGGSVKLLGTITTPNGPNYCFQSFIRVCAAGVNPGR